MGPVGLLLETVHINGAVFDNESLIRQYNQPPINVLETPFQDLKPLWRLALVRNRTEAMCDTRKECEGLKEIDDYASRPCERSKTTRAADGFHKHRIRAGLHARALVSGRCAE